MHFKEATLITSIALFVLAAGLYWFGLGALDTADPSDDSGAVQGFAIFAAALIVALFVSTVIFPSAGLSLEKSGTFTWRLWTRRVLAGVGLLSLIASIVGVLAIGGSLLDVPEIVTMAVMFFCISVMFLVPFAYLWKSLVLRITSRSNRSRVERAPV